MRKRTECKTKVNEIKVNLKRKKAAIKLKESQKRVCNVNVVAKAFEPVRNL